MIVSKILLRNHSEEKASESERERMERGELESKDDALKAQIVIRCAKAAALLSSLKLFPNHTLISTHHDKNKESEMLMKAVTDLKIELVRERMKNKRIKLCSLMEVLLQVMVMLSLWSFCLMLAFKFDRFHINC